MRLVTSGERPVRLGSPRMKENTWMLIQDCWKAIPSERPTMAHIVMSLRVGTYQSLITVPNKVYCIAISRH